MEEDIKILENLKERKLYFTSSMFQTGWVELGEREKQAIENLIARNKDLEKNYINPNKARISYFDKGKGTEVVIEGFIPVSKVQEKIGQIKMSADYDWLFKYDYQDVIKILQELIED